ncbi:MAG: hypothetical protein AAGE80_10755 [Pseudomonadota bacterium]
MRILVAIIGLVVAGSGAAALTYERTEYPVVLDMKCSIPVELIGREFLLTETLGAECAISSSFRTEKRFFGYLTWYSETWLGSVTTETPVDTGDGVYKKLMVSDDTLEACALVISNGWTSSQETIVNALKDHKSDSSPEFVTLYCKSGDQA